MYVIRLIRISHTRTRTSIVRVRVLHQETDDELFLLVELIRLTILVTLEQGLENLSLWTTVPVAREV